MQIYKSTGKYTFENTDINFDFEYDQYESTQDAVDNLGEDVVLKVINRMVKVDAGNTSREKAKSANGHSTAKVMTEDQKNANKAKRAEDKALLDMLKTSGLDVDAIKALIQG